MNLGWEIHRVSPASDSVEVTGMERGICGDTLVGMRMMVDPEVLLGENKGRKSSSVRLQLN